MYQNSPGYDRRRPSPRRDRRDYYRRRRSFSPDRFGGGRPYRSPPGFKRFRRDEDYYDRYDHGSPYRRGRYDRDRDNYDRYHERRDGPDSYKEFILSLSNDVTPEEAHQRYQEYLAEWHGSSVKAEFEQFKDHEWMKAKHDPRAIVPIIEKHKKHAEEAAKEFAETVKPGKELDMHSDDFNQGVQKAQSEPKDEAGTDKGFIAPYVCWTKERIESDLKLSTELVQKLDAEKGIEGNTVLTLINEANAGEPKPQDSSEEKKDGEPEQKELDTLTVNKLDLLLTYLWKVHMVDYYSGHELNDKEYEDAKCRMLRPPKDHVSDEETDKRMLEELKVRVDAFWADRIKKGDPLQLKTQTARVEKAIEDFIEAQVIQIDNKKWGNKLSTKMFVGKEFVVKHIRLKHTAVLDAEKEKVLDEIYFDNFKKEKEEQEKKAAEQRERALRVGPQAMFGSYSGYPDGLGRGGLGMMGGQGMMGAPMVPGPMMGAPMGQILMPAPGAGPLGPFVLQPVPSAGGGVVPMDMSSMGGGRAFDARHQNTAGRFGGKGPGDRREYYDLDAPQNNRAVLDYGDL